MSVIDTSVLAPERIRPLRRAEYERLVELGYFEDEKIELLDGMLVEMSPIGAEHAYAVQQLNILLTPALVGRAPPRCCQRVRRDGPQIVAWTHVPDTIPPAVHYGLPGMPGRRSLALLEQSLLHASHARRARRTPPTRRL